MTVRFIVDTAADFSVEEAKELDITLLPMTISFGETQYKDAFDIDHRKFFEMLIENEELPRTSMIPPAKFAEEFKKVTAAGDTAVVIVISSKLSGTYQSAVLAAQDHPGKIFVVDSLNATAGQRLLVEYGIRLKQKNISAEDIAAALERARANIRILALVDTLEYLHKGGRISKTVAFAGSVLSIKPVLTIDNGEIFMKGKARGSKQANNLLRELVSKCGGIDFDMPFSLFYSGLSDAVLQKYVEDSKDLWSPYIEKIPIMSMGATIGTHIGPGATGVAFFAKE